MEISFFKTKKADFIFEVNTSYQLIKSEANYLMGVFAKNFNLDSAYTHFLFFASTPFNAHGNKKILHYLSKPKFEMLPNEIVPFVIN